LLGDEEEMVGRAAIRSLAGLGDDAAIDMVANVLLNRKRPVSMRGEAAQALGRCRHPDAVTILMEAVESASAYSEAEPVFFQVMEALARKGAGERFSPAIEPPFFLTSPVDSRSDSTAGFLVEFLTDADPEVRGTAARSLGGASME